MRQVGVPFAVFCASTAVLLALTSMAAGFGSRWGWWGFRTGIALLRWVAYAEIAVALLSLLGCVLAATIKSKSALALSLIGFVIGLAAVSVPVRMWLTVKRVPAIHDIATDTENPPMFDAILKLRKDAPNPVEYGGSEIAEQQHKAYPDITPLILEVPPARTFERALAVAREMGWEIVSANPEQRSIEATDTTFWFGFKDDIAIRIAPEGSGSRIDVRSVSRVGKSDVGTNARRIRSFLKALKKSV